MDNNRPKIEGVIYQYDKRSGITYAYENHPYYEKGTGKRKATRKLIGRLDENTNTIVPTDGRKKRKQERDTARLQAHNDIADEARKAQDKDYKVLYEELLARWANLEARVSALERLTQKSSQ